MNRVESLLRAAGLDFTGGVIGPQGPGVQRRASHQTPVVMPGSLIDDRPGRHCDRCLTLQPRGGGCDLSPTRWVCSVCWKRHYLSNSRGGVLRRVR